MPYMQEYNTKTVGKAKGSAPNGGQGKAVKIMPMYNMSKSTSKTKFPA